MIKKKWIVSFLCWATVKLFSQEDSLEDSKSQFSNLASVYKKTTSNSEKQDAEWQLVKILQKMSLNYSSSLPLLKIVKRGSGPENKYFFKAFDTLRMLDDYFDMASGNLDMIFLTPMNESDFENSKSASFYFYNLGVRNFLDNKWDRAEESFKKVTKKSKLSNKSLYYIGIIKTLTGNTDAAIKYFEVVSKSKLKSSEENWLRELSNISLARVYYEKADYKTAIEFYAKIPRFTGNWLPAIYEAAWAFFLMNKPGNTLGNIHTIISPFFEQSFYPESYLLQAFTYVKLCRFEEAKISLTHFEKKFQKVFNDFQDFVKEIETDKTKIHKYIGNYLNKSLIEYESSKVIIDALANSDTYKQSYAVISLIDQESKLLNDMDFDKGATVFLNSIKKYLNKQRSIVLKDSSDKLYLETLEYSKTLKELFEQSKLITAEIMIGSVDTLKKELDIQVAKKEDIFIGGMNKLKVGQGLEYWPFEGEYWLDELGGYVYNIESKCTKDPI